MSFVLLLPPMIVLFTWVVCSALIGRPKSVGGSRFAAGAMVQSRGVALLLIGLVLSELSRLGASGADPASLLGMEAATPGAGRSAGHALGAWVLLTGAAAPVQGQGRVSERAVRRATRAGVGGLGHVPMATCRRTSVPS